MRTGRRFRKISSYLVSVLLAVCLLVSCRSFQVSAASESPSAQYTVTSLGSVSVPAKASNVWKYLTATPALEIFGENIDTAYYLVRDSNYFEFEVFFSSFDLGSLSADIKKYDSLYMSFDPVLNWSAEPHLNSYGDNTSYFQAQYFTTVPFVLVNGVRYEFVNRSRAKIEIPFFTSASTVQFGMRVSVNCEMSLTVTSNINSAVSLPGFVYGHAYFNNSMNATTVWFYGVNYVSSSAGAIIGAINGDNNAVVDALNKQTDTVANGYDSSSGTASNDKLSSSLGEMNRAEDDAVASVEGSLKDYGFTDVLDFSVGLLSGLSFVTAFVNSFVTASGQLAVVISVLYCIAFLAVVLGLWRFFRGS